MKLQNRKIDRRKNAPHGSGWTVVRLAACSVFAGVTLCGVATGDDTLAEPLTPTVTAAPSEESTPAPDALDPEEAPSSDATPATPEQPTPSPDATPAEQPTAAVDLAPAVPGSAPTTAPTSEPKPVEPKAVEPKAVEPKAVEPITAEPKVEPKTLEPKAAETKSPDAGVIKVPVPATTAAAPEGMVAKGLSTTGNISLMVNKSTVLTTRVPYKRVSIAQPDIADVNLVGPLEVLVTAKKPGSTQLIFWDDQDHSQVIDVVVGFDLRGLETQIAQMFPRGKITVESANGTIVLRGHVPDLQTAQKAVQVATPYGVGEKGGTVLNFLEVSGGQQVVLQVRFAEVSRSVTENLGFNAFATDGKFALGFSNGPGGSPVGALAGGTPGGVSPTIPVFGSARFGQAQFEYFISALRSNSLLRILAEPNLTAISGQPASFLAGGEYPIPVPQTSGGGTAITIEYKTYGIQLNFTPTVLGDGRVRLLCTPAVSELDYTNAVTLNGFTIPALTTRTVNTTVELAEGQTFALAGLLQNQVKGAKSITPILGDLPVLGALFRSVNYQRSETELVILVTPRMVEALNPNQVPTIPGEHWRDPTEAQLFLGTDLGGPAPDTRHAPVRSSRFYGTTGFSPAPAQQK